MSRRDRRGCDYDAYLPDPLVGWNLSVTADVAADVADAEAAVRRLNDAGPTHVGLEGLARFLLRAESVASSMIEGLAAAPRRLVAAEAALARGGDAPDQVAVEVLGNIAAMQSAIELASEVERFTLDDLLAVHRTLMERSRTPDLGGTVRSQQNWIGGNAYNPCSAAFVPPRRSTCPSCSRTCSSTSTGTTTRHWSRPRWHMPSSRPSSRLPTVTVGPGGRWFMSSCVAAGWRRRSCHRSVSSLRPGRTRTLQR